MYPFGYNYFVYTFLRTEEFDVWLRNLKDPVGKARIILARIDSAELGNFGDSESVGDGISEMHTCRAGLQGLLFTYRQGHLPIAMRRRQVDPEKGHKDGESDP